MNDAAERLQSTAGRLGLAMDEADRRLSSDGLNELPRARRSGLGRRAFSVLREPCQWRHHWSPQVRSGRHSVQIVRARWSWCSPAHDFGAPNL